MTQFETLSTAGQPARERAAYWNRLMSESPTSTSFEPVDPGNFSAELIRTKIGDTWFFELSTAAATVRHPVTAPPRSSGLVYALHLVLDGSSLDRQWGRECRLEAGDFAIYACGARELFEAVHEMPMRKLLIGIPSNTLRRYLPSPERVVAVPMSGHTGVSGLVSTLLRDYWRRCREQGGEVADPRVMNGILELLAVAYANVSQNAATPSQSASYHKSQILAYIESHLGDTGLTPTRIASVLRMTPRNLHYLFASEGETIARYILRRRLEESIRALTCVPPQRRTLTEIALDLGFGSVTHFGRAFRRCYGMTPSEYRSGGFRVQKPGPTAGRGLTDAFGAVPRQQSGAHGVTEHAPEEPTRQEHLEDRQRGGDQQRGSGK